MLWNRKIEMIINRSTGHQHDPIYKEVGILPSAYAKLNRKIHDMESN